LSIAIDPKASLSKYGYEIGLFVLFVSGALGIVFIQSRKGKAVRIRHPWITCWYGR
jgi:hypothetical protein